jgi:hypothetical protein
MAIKRKTISIKKVRLIQPSYKPPQKIVNVFTAPLGIRPEEVKVDVKKKRKHTRTVKLKKPKVEHKPRKAISLTKSNSGKLELKAKQKRTRIRVKKVKPKSSRVGRKQRIGRKPVKEVSNFPLANEPTTASRIEEVEDLELSDEYIDWSSAKQSAIDRLYSALHSIADENPDASSRKLAHMGADYAVNYLKDTFIDYDEDTLAEFLLSYPLADFFDSYVLFYGGLGLVSGDTSQLYKLEDPLVRYADNLSYNYKKDLANSDRLDDI